MPETPQPILSVDDLRKRYAVRRGWWQKPIPLEAVRGVSFAVRKGEILGLVGESGCGKSTLGRLLLKLERPSAGRIFFAGEEVTHREGKALRPFRRAMQIIFQDPYSSLNPRMTVGDAIGEVLKVHRLGDKAARGARIAELLEQVGLSPQDAGRYPHEFSGGQRQRVGIARALSVSPQFLVADEPVSALDVSIQAQILELLADIRRRYSLSMLFISHDLRVVNYFTDRVAVMYLGNIVEVLSARAIEKAQHPYTQALLKSVPIADPKSRRPVLKLEGEPPSPLSPPSGCAFHPRCPYAEARCREEVPALRQFAERDYQVACHLVKGPIGD